VAIVGDIPSGLPAPAIPNIETSDVDDLLAAAMAVFLMAYVEGTGATQTFAKKHKYRVDGNQELLAIGASNAACGLFQSYPVGGGFSRTAVNDEAGARTQLAGLGTGVLVGVVALFLTGLFYNLPEAILGAVVIVAVKGLFNVLALRRLYQVSRQEFLIALAAMAGVLVFGMLEGVLIGVVLSLVLVLYHASQPTAILLGRVPGTNLFSDLARHPGNEVIPEVLVYRVDGPIFYVNASVVSADLERLIGSRDSPPKLVIFDLSPSPRLDLAAADMLVELDDDLSGRGIELRLAHVDGPVRDRLRDIGAAERFGETHSETPIEDIVAAWRAEQRSSGA
jgi:MFS superfamily sulfate permease-like transporter